MYSNEFFLGDFMGYLKFLGIVVFFLMSMSSAVAEEIRSETDACLVTLYNYPAETARYSVSQKRLPKSTLSVKKNQQAVKTDEEIHSRISLASQSAAEK